MNRPFRLATLLKLREATRDERRGALAEAFRADAVLVERIAAIDFELAAMVDDYRRASLPGRVHVDRLIDCHRQDTILRALRQEQLRQRELLAAEIERRRQALVAAEVEVRALEKLRERQRQREVVAELRSEAARLDEFAVSRVAREREDSREEALWGV